MCPLIPIFGVPINAYLLSILISFLAAAVYLWIQISKLRLPHLGLFPILILVGLAVQSYGGVVIPWLYKWLYFNAPPDPKSFDSSGRYFHSVFLSMLAYVLIVCRALRWPTKKILDLFAIATLLMSAIGRIGCFLQGCCSGKPTSLPWGLNFPDNPALRVHPTQIYMFVSEMVLFFLLLRIQKNKKFDSEVFWKGVLYYSIYRFLIEFFRTNPLFLMNLTHAQVFSCFTLVLALFVLDGQKAPYEKNLPS